TWVSLTVSPSWLSPGASVNLSCKVDPPSTGWRFYWYKAVPDRSQEDYRYELLADSINGTVEDSFIIHGQRHTAGYACRAGRGNQEDFTDYSYAEFVWSADAHPAVSVSVSPDREQHFTDESVTVNCRGAFTHSRVWGAYKDGPIWVSNPCPDWETMSGSCSFNLKLEEPKKSSFQTEVFWCESGSGEFSSSVNITTVDGDVLLVSPVHPVTEGASVTLSCRLRGQNTLSNVFFYHNDKLVQNDSRGELKISAVSQSDEGFYKCEHSGKASPQSWMAVKAAGSSSFHVMWVIRPVIGIVLIILPLLVCRFRRSKGQTLIL
ncbi:low affinity immunoglobulin gamma Fc region receptor III-like, partial [Cyprinodon tularosa]|uniref:low affinity immunoglobulin gamma Fc region receptor III-like n=1 Tax=Cyprinodon tularosa TaxID=77115 RepID=UPI0018E27942